MVVTRPGRFRANCTRADNKIDTRTRDRSPFCPDDRAVSCRRPAVLVLSCRWRYAEHYVRRESVVRSVGRYRVFGSTMVYDEMTWKNGSRISSTGKSKRGGARARARKISVFPRRLLCAESSSWYTRDRDDRWTGSAAHERLPNADWSEPTVARADPAHTPPTHDDSASARARAARVRYPCGGPWSFLVSIFISISVSYWLLSSMTHIGLVLKSTFTHHGGNSKMNT